MYSKIIHTHFAPNNGERKSKALYTRQIGTGWQGAAVANPQMSTHIDGSVLYGFTRCDKGTGWRAYSFGLLLHKKNLTPHRFWHLPTYTKPVAFFTINSVPISNKSHRRKKKNDSRCNLLFCCSSAATITIAYFYFAPLRSSTLLCIQSLLRFHHYY